MTRLPRLAALLLRLTPVARERRDEVTADLLELFDDRRAQGGRVRAHLRLYRDIASLARDGRAPAAGARRHARPSLLRDARADVRYAARLFARQPVILLLAILGLSLGLGIATAAFTIMNATVLRGEGLVDSDRAPGILRTSARSTSTTWTYDEFRMLREGATRIQVEGLVTDAAGVRTAPAEESGPSATIAFVSGGFFDATGGRVVAGRALEPSDETRTSVPPVVISFMFWSTRMKEDPEAIGRTIRVGRTDATIVGIAARGFSLPSNRELWMPLPSYGAVYSRAAVAALPRTGIQTFGRLLPGVTLAEADAQLDGVTAAIPALHGDPVGVTLDADEGLGRVSAGDTVAIAAMVFGIIGLVVLLACANVATVLVSTAITREREMGVRAALGASRGRIIRQLVTESLALGVVAAAIGLLLVYWSIPAIRTLIEAPSGIDLAPDFTVFLFLGILTLLAGAGAGLAPALHGRGADLVTPLKGAPSQNRVAPRRLRSALVITQAAVSVLLIVMSAIFVRASFQAAKLDVGFDPEGLYAVSTSLGIRDDGGTAIRSFYARALPEVLAVPGVTSAALSEMTPFSGSIRTSMTREGAVIYLHRVRAEYFETVGLRPLAGRGFTREEAVSNAPVAIVSQTIARAYWPGRSPLGEKLPASIPMAGVTRTVVGIVADTVTDRADQRNTLAIYEPLDPAEEMAAQLLVRLEPGSTGAMQEVTMRLRAVDPQADIRVSSVAALLRQETNRPRTMAMLTAIVGGLAIVLCVIGLYGLTASLAGQREREMCVRLAIGASPWDLLRLLMWDSLKPLVIGLAIGALAAFAAGQALGSVVFFGISPQDPIALLAAVVLLLAAAVAAVLAPTRRAAAVDAALVLR